jgi:hypothetical protein
MLVERSAAAPVAAFVAAVLQLMAVAQVRASAFFVAALWQAK